MWLFSSRLSSAVSRCPQFNRMKIYMHKSSHQLKDGYFVEIDGKFESEYGTFTGALKAGFELRQKFPQSQVKVHDVNEHILADEQSDKKATAAS